MKQATEFLGGLDVLINNAGSLVGRRKLEEVDVAFWDEVIRINVTTMMFVTAVVQDPVYLEQRYIVISHFRKEPDGSKWDPTPCSARW